MIKVLLSPEWILRLSQFNQLIMGYSGGLDSTVLLHVLAAHPILLKKLVAVHVNHGINANAHFWQEHCNQFCQKLGIFFRAQSVHFDRSANIEEGARIARYAVFSSLVKEQDCLILGHHLDDQAETFLLQLFRGAGVDGLAAMPEFTQFGFGQLARPFLHYYREQLEHYALLHQLNWVEDESNCDIAYSRNYLRQEIIPLLKNRWPRVVGNIARTASHCQQAKRNLDALAISDLSWKEIKNRSLSECALSIEFGRETNSNERDKSQNTLTDKALAIESLKNLNFDRIANILRVWLKKNQVQLPSTITFHRLIHEVIFSSQDAAPRVSWGNTSVRRYQNHLYLDKKNRCNLPSYVEWTEFPLPLNLGTSEIKLVAQKANQGLIIPQNAAISIRFRQGGEDFFWHGQTKRLKKLFQEWDIPPWLRDRVPLVYFDNTLAAVVGYAMSDLFFTQNSSNAWVFEQLPF
ncbi:tRNA lysidine(34) synthetase TilS [Legionella cincinnatiensis]|uniref:tRNA(Ile)-lysidine synthase n=1 Tax=Legionella cincinnatiensis TaxID=28085 RepID=A0A378II10_9GAMM|nr:tRNA lysidine(34) synthetase TilS [Legionella cincinnatiensis]KTC82016.1 cell cycle protein MesJ [Legionella cincinnatiensis]STX34799.1 cell cycle protein MesJ [Legionella cincinnatiensis]